MAPFSPYNNCNNNPPECPFFMHHTSQMTSMCKNDFHVHVKITVYAFTFAVFSIKDGPVKSNLITSKWSGLVVRSGGWSSVVASTLSTLNRLHTTHDRTLFSRNGDDTQSSSFRTVARACLWRLCEEAVRRVTLSVECIYAVLGEAGVVQLPLYFVLLPHHVKRHQK